MTRSNYDKQPSIEVPGDAGCCAAGWQAVCQKLNEAIAARGAGDDAAVYLGTKEGIDPDDMVADLEAAQRGEKAFDDQRFVNRWPAKKHDHFLIPAAVGAYTIRPCGESQGQQCATLKAFVRTGT